MVTKEKYGDMQFMALNTGNEILLWEISSSKYGLLVPIPRNTLLPIEQGTIFVAGTNRFYIQGGNLIRVDLKEQKFSYPINQGINKFGRDSMKVDDLRMSGKEHFQIINNNGQYQILDNSSSNLTWIKMGP